MRVSNVDVILRRCGIQIEDGGCGLEKFNNFSLFVARCFATLWRAFSSESRWVVLDAGAEKSRRVDLDAGAEKSR